MPAVGSPTAIAPDNRQLESVVVSKRHEPYQEPDEGPLEPISEYSEFEPQLADPEPITPPVSKPAPELAAAAKPPVAEPAVAKPTQTAQAPAAAKPQAAAEKPVPKLASLPVAKTPSAAPAPPVEQPASFRGVTPGVTPKVEVLTAWGEPLSVRKVASGEVLTYDIQPFQAVELLVTQGKVSVVRAQLAAAQTVDELAIKLHADDIESVEIADPATGQPAGVAFPEKGMLMLVAPADCTPTAPLHVTHVVLQPLDAEAFALRAETRGPLAMSKNNADLERALRIEPRSAHINWLAANAYITSGNLTRATAVAKQAVDLAPTNPAYRLCWARAMEGQGEFDPAVLETRTVLDDASAPDVVRAAALSQMGRLASLGDAEIAEKAIGFHTKAIDIADRLTRSTDTTERRLAKQVLVDAHLGIAREIARRDYARKSQVVGEWIGRASGIAEEAIEHDGGSLLLRLQVAREAMGAIADIKPALDPAPWVKEAQETADKLLVKQKDKLLKARIEWDLGETYFHAVRVCHARQQVEQALGYGSLAIEHLSAGAEPRISDPRSSRTVGQLYFYLGAVNAVHKQDHTEAVAWYDKAYPLLINDERKSELIAPRRAGETLVSMAVSYWQQGQRDRAVELTTAGAKMMETAVVAGVLDEPALAVPYGNLATMKKELGEAADATRYATLARGARGATTTVAAKPSYVLGAQPSGDRGAGVQQRPKTNSASSGPLPQPTAPAVVRNRTAAANSTRPPRAVANRNAIRMTR